jgi:hypothetical protein
LAAYSRRPENRARAVATTWRHWAASPLSVVISDPISRLATPSRRARSAKWAIMFRYEANHALRSLGWNCPRHSAPVFDDTCGRSMTCSPSAFAWRIRATTPLSDGVREPSA